MYLKKLELSGFKSFAKATKLEFPASITAIVGPNGAGKSNIAEAVRWVMGEQSIKTLRGKKGEDLIFNGSQTAPRLSKASVSLFFDNRKKFLPIDYDEVKISRRVYRDGTNEYLLNNSRVRFKDIVELLSKIGIGSSSHNIISQGESDRILNASLKERRQMLEDALGLKIYQLKKTEAEKKLIKTEENINQVESLRREIQPHLRFLKKQTEKAEQVLSLKEKLKNNYLHYFANEKRYLDQEEEKIKNEKEEIEKNLSKIGKKFFLDDEDSKTANLKNEIETLKEGLGAKEIEIAGLRSRRNLTERELGRFEGIIEAVGAKAEKASEASISRKETKNFIAEIENNIEKGLKEAKIEEIKNILGKIKILIKEFSEKLGSGGTIPSSELKNLKEKQKDTRDLLNKIEKEEKELQKECEELKTKTNEKGQLVYTLEKDRYEAELKIKELKGVLASINAKEDNIKLRKEEVAKERQEAEVLIGNIIDQESEVHYLEHHLWEGERYRLQREIEKLKIKLEDSGEISEEIIKEYEEVKKRDEFFEKELIDLFQAVQSLKDILRELEEKIDHDFREGIEKINQELQNFFILMFGGGKAELRRVLPKKHAKKDENLEAPTPEGVGAQALEDAGEEEIEEGVDVHVNLPKKRIHSLSMLSGGERALTSIALLFAMVQVNPPPFLVLDETDAALDEANSQKHAKMLKDLSKQTQLILITHNRETMKQADILYGVTMGSDSISKLLSIKFIEAEQYTNR